MHRTLSTSFKHKFYEKKSDSLTSMRLKEYSRYWLTFLGHPVTYTLYRLADRGRFWTTGNAGLFNRWSVISAWYMRTTTLPYAGSLSPTLEFLHFSVNEKVGQPTMTYSVPCVWVKKQHFSAVNAGVRSLAETWSEVWGGRRGTHCIREFQYLTHGVCVYIVDFVDFNI